MQLIKVSDDTNTQYRFVEYQDEVIDGVTSKVKVFDRSFSVQELEDNIKMCEEDIIRTTKQKEEYQGYLDQINSLEE